VGGVSERPTQDQAEGVILLTPCGSRRWKAPGPRNGVALRGAVSERGAWSVRQSAEVSSSADGRTDDNRCSSDAEEGNVVGSRTKKAWAPDARARNALAPGGRVLHSVRRPVHVNRGSTRGGIPSWGHAVCVGTRSGKPGQPGGTGTVTAQDGRSAARHASSAHKACSRVRSRKGRRLAAVVPTRIRESRSKCPHVVVVAEVGRRHLSAPNTLVRSAPKRVAARVNGGLARGHRRR
jgi:hypothetical protein